MATTTRETKIELQVFGYSPHRYRDNKYMVRVLVSGQGPHGKLSGAAEVSPDGTDYDLMGDGRYSAMHGNSAMYSSHPVYAEIRTLAIEAAKQWVAANPNALHEFKVKQAAGKVALLQADVERSQASLTKYTALLTEAKEALAELERV